MVRLNSIALAACALGVLPPFAYADDACKIAESKTFAPQHVAISLAGGAGGVADGRFVFFNAKLRVNTDGAPNSYHPQDPKGLTLAINNIVNGVGISRVDGGSMSYSEKIQVFENFRDAGWQAPTGFKVHWQNVIAATKVNGKSVPCVFTSGDFKGYFGSLTKLTNGLPEAAAGECGVKDQLDERLIPALVMPGGSNPLKDFGADVGDLVLVQNPANGVTVAAVIGDSGPPDNLGEGSVALNMALLAKTVQPTNYKEAKLLDTGSKKMLVAILPATKGFALARPYSPTNLTTRVAAWAAAHGYSDSAGLAKVMASCAAH